MSKNLNRDSANVKTPGLIVPNIDEWAFLAMKLGEAGIILSTTPLAGDASYTQGDQDRLAPVISGITSAIPIGRVRGLVSADQAGTLFLEHKDPGEVYSTLASVAVSANVTAEIPWTGLTKRFFRFRFANGAVAQGNFSLIQQVTGLQVDRVELTGNYAVVDAVIPQGGTESTEIDFRNYKYLTFIMPAAWTAATIQVKGSAISGGTKQIPKNEAGFAMPAINVAVNEPYSIETYALYIAPFPYLSLVSSIPQEAARTIKVMMKA